MLDPTLWNPNSCRGSWRGHKTPVVVAIEQLAVLQFSLTFLIPRFSSIFDISPPEKFHAHHVLRGMHHNMQHGSNTIEPDVSAAEGVNLCRECRYNTDQVHFVVLGC